MTNPAQATAAHVGLNTKAQAELVGEGLTTWYAYKKGVRNPTSRKLEDWCTKASISLSFHPRTGWVAKEAT